MPPALRSTRHQGRRNTAAVGASHPQGRGAGRLISRMIGTTLAAKRSAAALALLPSLVPMASLGPPELPAIRLGRSERRLRPLRDHHALRVGHGGQDVQRQPGGVRIIDRHELDAGVHHGGDEGHVAGKSVELGHHQLGPLLLTGRERGGKPWPVIATLAALDLNELGRQRPLPAVEVVGHSLALGLKLEAESLTHLPLWGFGFRHDFPRLSNTSNSITGATR